MAIKRQDIQGCGINYYRESKCPTCKKTFEHTDEWVYWRGYYRVRTYFCSWHCVRAYDAKKPAKKLKGEYPSDWLNTRCKVR